MQNRLYGSFYLAPFILLSVLFNMNPVSILLLLIDNVYLLIRLCQFDTPWYFVYFHLDRFRYESCTDFVLAITNFAYF